MDFETKRLEALRSQGVLDTPQDERFDQLTRLAATLFKAPIALVSLVDGERQWFKSRQGLDARETPRAMAFCDHVLPMGPHAVMVVENAIDDPRFANNPLVLGDPAIRFYAGAALTTSDGFNLGTLCVIDTKPRSRPSEGEIDGLKALASVVVNQIEMGRIRRDLEEQKRLLALADTASGVGHWRYDVAKGRVTWSDELYRIHGMERTEGDLPLDAGAALYDAGDRAKLRTLFERAVAEGGDCEYEMRLYRPDGALRHINCRSVCDLDENGVTVAVLGIFQDITQHIEALEKARHNEARYRLLAENANDVVCEIDISGRIDYISPAVKAMVGFTSEEMIGRQMSDFIHPDDRGVVRERFYKALEDDEGWQVEYRVLRKDGEFAWVEARPKLVRDPKTGLVASVTDVIRDITVRKGMETALRSAMAEAEGGLGGEIAVPGQRKSRIANAVDQHTGLFRPASAACGRRCRSPSLS